MRTKRRARVVGLLLAGAVVACGGAPGADGDAAATAAARIKGGMEAQAGAVQAMSTQAAAAAATQAPAAASTTQAAIGAAVKGVAAMTQDQIAQAARAEAARALGVPVDQVAIERVESVDWRDSSLGCSEPGKVYAQVITPGFRVVLTAGGQRREVHADTGGRLVVCPNPTQ